MSKERTGDARLDIADAISKCKTLDELAGFLSTQNFSSLHPEYALQFLILIKAWRPA